MVAKKGQRCAYSKFPEILPNVNREMVYSTMVQNYDINMMTGTDLIDIDK